MGRLIDADKLKVYLQEYLGYGHAVHWVDAQPTAYDVEKVQKQIEEMFGCDPMYYGTEAKWAVDKAIDIVRKGGVE